MLNQGDIEHVAIGSRKYVSRDKLLNFIQQNTHKGYYLTRTLGERYRRIAERRVKRKALVAIGRSILILIWHLLADPDTRYHDLGPDFYDTRIGPDASAATMSANSKPSATPSPSHEPPDPADPHR